MTNRRWARAVAVFLLALMAAVTSPVHAQGVDPFRVVVLGDSIMWGQGLPEADKFTTQVREWLARELSPRPVVLQVWAHSGAVIRPDPEDGEAALPGEIGSSFPSITAQVALVPPVDRANTDLVLVDGGINDVGVLETIVNPTLPSGPDGVRSLTPERVTGPMRDLLALIGRQFPRAQVVVTGYYAIVSPATPLAEVFNTVQTVDPATAAACQPAPLCAVILDVVRGTLIQQSAAWEEESNQSLESAVERANRAVGATRFHFVPITLRPEHAYGTANSYLWRIGEDPLAAERAELCEDLGAVDGYCLWAATGHPNRKGAALYRDAIIAQLEPLLPLWQ
jgi:lysophospholipase L1-like esterase